MQEDLKIRRALLSVFDKTGLVEFAGVLNRFGVDLIATGGTLSTLVKAGLKVTPLEKIGHFPEMLDGRVKTLQPEIFAGILARKPSKDHLDQISKHGIRPIDMVVCNFYAFEATAAKEETKDEELIEMIDIGGPSLVRASSKNFESVCIVPASQFYPEIQKEIERKSGMISYATRRNMAIKAFEIVAGYDIAIYNTLYKRFVPQQKFPETFFLAARAYEVPKYGENPDQKAMIYAINGAKGGIPEWNQLYGDPRSYNNYLDIASSFEILEGFERHAAAATVKHGQISGFAYSNDGLSDAYRLAHECDPEADFGNTTVLNKVVDAETAELIGRNDDDSGEDKSVYTEIVLAPGYSPEALEILKGKQKKKMRLIQTTTGSTFPYDVKVNQGLTLIQDVPDYKRKLDAGKVTVATISKPSQSETAILLGLWELARRVESNAIVIGNGEVSKDNELTKLWTLGVGTFRKRNGATKIALDNAGSRARGAFCASDGFFPFPDSVEMLAGAGIKGIIQPGGSISDKKVVEISNKHSIPMLITHERAFKH
ncbi:MAG: bifunctional phosphoribosylaminoimidazolecarboxamide formyltransferase/IMP cyclohydrolase [Nitrososphaerota archaeon]|nr:bifunctional phosphoribosylaminoimidazolecarboxamide formyltransferase/IMP cyclohydrolase [Nitrososphaerota archaeon]MDG6924297.1 bifunctional phosphoribosylaminoimidazolecarboxamide formyltransferase/IMP cyclohydrolase [Nitrososphaerota archaeon]